MAKQQRKSKRTRFKQSIDHLARTSPARLVLILFGAIILVMTLLLSLPIATTTGKPANLVDAIFTSTSRCV